MIPLIDLKVQHREIEQELLAVFQEALREGRFIGGPEVEHFEQEFAQFCETEFCIGVNSGTDALRFAAMACGIREDDEVLTVPNTFVATTEAISQAGARPAFVDIDEANYTMDADELRKAIALRYRFSSLKHCMVNNYNDRPLRGIIPVHLYGLPANMDEILEVARDFNLTVIEDACQAHGARYFSATENRWRRVGSMGDCGAFSFYCAKNLGACGEGGAVTTNDEDVAIKIRMLRDHGQKKRYHHLIEGYNGRLDAIQAGILRIKLRRLNEWNAMRIRNARMYNDMLAGLERVITPCEPPWGRSVCHLYVIRTMERDELRAFLEERDIGTGLHYPIPLHLQEAYVELGLREGDFPVAERVATEILSLPMYPELKVPEIEYVVERIWEFYAESAMRKEGDTLRIMRT